MRTSDRASGSTSSSFVGPKIAAGVALLLLVLCGIASALWGSGPLERVWGIDVSPRAGFVAVQTQVAMRVYAIDGTERLLVPGGRSAAFSQDDRHVAVATPDEIVIHDLVAGHDLAVFKTQSNFNSSVAFSPDGTRLAIFLEQTNTLQLRDVATGAMQWEVDAHEDASFALAFSADGLLLVTGGSDEGSTDHQLCLWDTSTGTRLSAWTRDRHAHVREAIFLDAQSLMIFLSDGRPNDFYSIADLTAPVRLEDHPLAGTHGHAALSPDRDLLAVALETGDYWTTSVALRNVTTGEEILRTGQMSGPDWDATVDSDTNRLVVATSFGTLHWWDVVTGRLDQSSTGYRPARVIWSWRIILCACVGWLIAWCGLVSIDRRRNRPRVFFDWLYVPAIGLVAIAILQTLHWAQTTDTPNLPDPLNSLELMMLVELAALIGIGIGTILTKSWIALVLNVLCFTALGMFTVYCWMAVVASV